MDENQTPAPADTPTPSMAIADDGAAVVIDAPEPAVVADKYGVGEPFERWCTLSKTIFNSTYRRLFDNQSVMKHPKAPMLSDEQWRTVAWNAAWVAADDFDKLMNPERAQHVGPGSEADAGRAGNEG